jgi:hypothetical protein
MTMTTENRKGHPVRNASVGAVIVILMALLVFPGFLAAGLSRVHVMNMHRAILTTYAPAGGIVSRVPKDAFFYHCPRALMIVLRLIFTPAEKLSMVSTALCDFYAWQYGLAGGVVVPLAPRGI